MNLSQTDLFTPCESGKEKNKMVLTPFELKDRGQEIVIKHADPEWKSRVFSVIERLSKNQCSFTGDDVRAIAESEGIGKPHHNNCWGAMMSMASKAGFIRRTGKYVASSRPEAHARMLAIWESIQKI